MHTLACTHMHCPIAQETCRGPSAMAIKVQPSGHGASDSGPPEGGSLDFWDTKQGNSKPRRRRKSLKNFSLISTTFWGIWHWRVSAVSCLSPCSPCPLLPLLQPAPSSEGRRTPPPCQGPTPDAAAGLPQDSLFSHSFIHSFSHSLIHWTSVFYPYYVPGPTLGIWNTDTRKAWSKHFRKCWLSP